METILDLAPKTMEDKIIFYELLLFNITVMNRAIWDDTETTDRTKVDCLKWSNELSHRVWNFVFELKRGEENETVHRLIDHLDFYRKKSDELAEHLGEAIKATVDQFSYNMKN